ncbi:hypothetical protein C8R44DRAFT_882101 [Mycena epipterygia]|nr:hypothetical protein C8R44DRAFT_882101 [Mycena epipterygia]
MPFGQSLRLRLTLLGAILGLVNAQKYTLSQDLAGQNFLNAFKYNESIIDYNSNGNVHFLSQSDAVAAKLTYIDNGRVIIKVDNTTNGINDTMFGRNTVYLESNQLMNIGSLLIFDVNHIPFGCSVWPSLFTQGEGQKWPAAGEIDIIENVNLAKDNQFALHVASDQCVQPTSIASNQTGRITTANGGVSYCNVTSTNNVGCVVAETKANSFGSGFASQGGGVYALLWDTAGIAMWYFGRSSVPSDIGGTASPDPTTWGKASAWYPASSCDPVTNFGPQTITLYTNICGAFANVPSVFDSTCGSIAPNCSSLVQDPANYNDAYWEINYLRVFTNGETPPSNASASANSSSGSGGSGSSGSGSGSPTSSGGGSVETGKNSAPSFAGAGLWELLLVPASLMLLGFLSF